MSDVGASMRDSRQLNLRSPERKQALSDTTLSRRGFVALSAAGAASAMLFGLPGCGPKARTGQILSETGFEAGVYSASATGKGGPVTVEVTFSQDAIESIQVVDHQETRYISDVALSKLPKQIVEYQSLGIDTITGATLSSMAVLNAVADCVRQSGGDAEALRQTAGPEKADAVVEIEADLVIAGAGASGMAAAMSAAQSGASKVIVLEKTSNIGGNCLVSGGYFEYIYPPEAMRAKNPSDYEALFDSFLERALADGADDSFIDALRRDYLSYRDSNSGTVYDSTALRAIETCLANHGKDCRELTASMPINDYDAPIVQCAEWFTDMGMEWYPEVFSIVGYIWPRWTCPTSGKCGEGYFDLFTDRIDSDNLPIEIITCTTATELIMEGPRVAGIKGQCDDGTTYLVRGSKGVVLATGGCSGNPEKLKSYNSYWNWSDDTSIPTTNTFGHTGDGLDLALSVGGCVAHMETPMMFPHADCKTFSTETTVGGFGMGVNRQGIRFVDETADRYTISQALMQQPDQVHFLISDAVSSGLVDGMNYFGNSEEGLIENGQLYRADTLEELAEIAGIDQKGLLATAETFTRYIQNGYDDDFGRTSCLSDIECGLSTPPFYASPRTWAAHVTTGGIVRDDHFRALNENGDPIDGLYVIGEVADGAYFIVVLSEGMALGREIFAS